MESVGEKEENQKLMEQLEYQIFYKKRDLEFTITNNTSKHRDLENNLNLCSSGFKISFAVFIGLLLIGKIFLSLIGIGNAFVTSAFGLIYLICGVFYFIIMLVLFIKTADSFWFWFENSDTKWGNSYCEKKGLFTLSMEQAECASLLVRYHNDMDRLNEIEEKMNSPATAAQLKEWLNQVGAIEIQPEKERTPSTQKGKWKRMAVSVILFLLFFYYWFL
ncbi:MAG: hypothetical protein NC412_14890 [Roseburia sp.]|nr:hypothetical protein [Roseburia sp.]MCM1279595.1 hypothetical protein [Robinsoniella sp.]